MQKYTFRFTTKGQKSLLQLPQDVQRRIILKLKKVEDADTVFDYSEKLTDHKNHYKIRIGNYRVVFVPEKEAQMTILLIVKTGHRKNIYKNL